MKKILTNYENEINKTYNTISNIYDEVMIKKAPLYKWGLYLQKIKSSSEIMKNKKDEFYKLLNIHLKEEKYKSFIILLAFFILFIVSSFNIGVSLLLMVYSLYDFIKFKNFKRDYNNLIKYEKETLPKIEIQANNITSYIKRELEKINDKKEKNDLGDIGLANYLIVEYIGKGVLPDIPDNIKNIMIKILQDDLNTTETDIINLLASAKILNDITNNKVKIKELK